MITVIGIFEDVNLAEDASTYLLGNEFKDENIDLHTHGSNPGQPDRVGPFFSHLFSDEKKAAHYASLGRKGSVVTVHAISAREAQEAVDVLNNYGAIDVTAADEIPGTGLRSQVIERVIDEDKRLRNCRAV